MDSQRIDAAETAEDMETSPCLHTASTPVDNTAAANPPTAEIQIKSTDTDSAGAATERSMETSDPSASDRICPAESDMSSNEASAVSIKGANDASDAVIAVEMDRTVITTDNEVIVEETSVVVMDTDTVSTSKEDSRQSEVSPSSSAKNSQTSAENSNKRPKSPQASSSSDSTLTSTSNATLMQDSPEITDSMQNLTVSIPEEARAEGETAASAESKKKRKKRKKKKKTENTEDGAEDENVKDSRMPSTENGGTDGDAAASSVKDASSRPQSAKTNKKVSQSEGKAARPKSGEKGREGSNKGGEENDQSRKEANAAGFVGPGDTTQSRGVTRTSNSCTPKNKSLSESATPDQRQGTKKQGQQKQQQQGQQKEQKVQQVVQALQQLKQQSGGESPQQQQQQQPRSQRPNQRQRQQQQQQQQQGEEGNSGQQTPGTDQKKKKHHHKKHQRHHFEEYWPQEKLSEELKRGTIFEGRIRINPKNYEDAYVPLPDGSADIYLPGLVKRNRALNGDTVAVQLDDRENWRVFSDQLNHYEQQNTPAESENAEEEEKAKEADDKAATASAMDVDKKTDNDNDNAPDVVVEEEEVVEYDSSGQAISTIITKPSPEEACPAQAPPSSAKVGNPKQGQGQKGTDSPNSARNKQRYVSVKDVMDKGSPVARQLFEHKGSEAGHEEKSVINMDKFMQKTGKVVAITERKHSRACSGVLRPMQDNNPNCSIFSPTDSRVPRIIIPSSDLPPGFKERPGDFANVLFIARITEWTETMKMPKGTLARSLGEAGEIEPQTEAILIENEVDDSEFSKKVLACLPQDLPWTIPASEFDYRRDFRKECVFTIDPSTARDLDDALSCRSLGDGTYEVGVHIADVSFFVKEGTELDEVARSRATSVYLVQKVIPMLPRLLCEQLCSLNPDEDRLTFSVVWKMTEDGEILEEWFGRSVIRSCVKLSYDHAQGFIDEPDREWTVEELPPISEGFTVEDIKSRVFMMDKMAKSMRKARFDSGALRLDQLKIQFTLDKESGLPNGYFVYEQRDSNKLVEEFMLLANMAVAHKIKSSFHDKALLRRHPPPQSRMIDELKDTCASLGFPIEVDTAKDIQRSLQRYTGEDELSKARLQVLVVLCSRPMQNAKYFCCGVLADEKLYHHYALNVPLYTHFTSPIRRYPDILVHRTLAAALGYFKVTDRSSSEIQVIAEHCNDKKTNAKRASELSNEIFFSVFVKEAGPLEEKGMVMNVLDKSFDVYVLKLGVVKRVYCEKLPLESFIHHKEGKRPELTMVWKPDDGCPHTVTQKVSIFSCVNCVLKSDPEPLKWSATIRRPQQGDPTYVQ